ncbi:MAG: toll/interleukin-1 receptor domain-containing protein [Anaerolineae bacterium]|nr:toll/interleukin-1 receptor domain-containing protein [Anaerolineae bacterium]
MDGHLFLSYSRQQFYFAESLAIHLQQKGIPIWFDMQQLEPGKDWAEGIQRGLVNSAGLVLVASRAALASPYVRLEWEAALKDNKPVYVVLFESVSLPDELLSTPIFDLRADFNRGVERLAKSIQENVPHNDRIPADNPLHLPTRLSRPVLTVAAAIFLVGLVVLWGASGINDLFPWYYPNEFVNSITLAYVIFGLYLSYQSWRFIRRQRIDFTRIYLYLFAIAGLLSSGFTALNVCLNLMLPHSSRYWVSAVGFTVIPILLGWLWWRAAQLMSNSPDILRWMPTGDASQNIRVRLNSKQRPRIISLPPTPKVFKLHYHTADSRIAAQITNMLVKHGFRMVRGDEEVGQHIAVVSNFTAQLEAANLPNAINVVASGISIPGDIRQLNAIQWVDYRTRSRQQLHALGEYLQEAADGRKDQRFYSLNVVPESLNKMVMPNGVRLFTYFLAGLAAGYLGVGLFGLLGTLFDMDISAVTIVGLPLGLILFGLRSAVLNRLITPMWIPVVLIICAGIGIVLQVRFDSFEPAILYIPVSALMVFYWDVLQNWLPTANSLSRRTQTLAASTWKPIWRLNIVLIVLNLGIMMMPFGLRSTGPTQIAQAVFDPSQCGPEPTATLWPTRIPSPTAVPGQTAVPTRTPTPQPTRPALRLEALRFEPMVTLLGAPMPGVDEEPILASLDTMRDDYFKDVGELEWFDAFIYAADEYMVASAWKFQSTGELSAGLTPDELISQTAARMMQENPGIQWQQDERWTVGQLRLWLIALNRPAADTAPERTEWLVSVQGETPYLFYIYGDTKWMSWSVEFLLDMLDSLRPI